MRAVAVTLLAAWMAGCTAIATSGDLLGFTGLGNDVRRFYERNAWEDNGSCLLPRMTAILRAEVVDEGPETATIRVRYVWVSSTGAGQDGGNTCRGTAERDFVIRPTDDRATVVGMTGGQRSPTR